MSQLRDLYEDGIWDVFSIQDLDSLKENGQMNVLAKTEDYLMIEAGKDFWKIDFKNEEITQYKDFISLEKNIDGQKVYSKRDLSLNKDYGAVLYDTIQATDISDLPTFSLEQRKNYFEGTSRGLVRYFMKGEFEKSIEKNRQKTKELTNNVLEPLNNKDTKIFYDALYITMDVLSVFYTFFNQKYKELKKEKLISNIIEKLDNNEIEIKEILSDKILNDNVPELKFVLEKWSKNIKQVKIETSITADEVLAKQNENVKSFVEELIQDPQINDVSEKLSHQEQFRFLQTEKFFQEIDTKISEEFGVNYKDKIKQSFENSQEKDPINFAYKQIVDKEIVQEMKLKYPDMTPKECGLVMSYLNFVIEEGKNASQELMSQKIAENKIEAIEGEKAQQTFGIVSDLLQRIMVKIDNSINQENQMKQR